MTFNRSKNLRVLWKLPFVHILQQNNVEEQQLDASFIVPEKSSSNVKEELEIHQQDTDVVLKHVQVQNQRQTFSSLEDNGLREQDRWNWEYNPHDQREQRKYV